MYQASAAGYRCHSRVCTDTTVLVCGVNGSWYHSEMSLRLFSIHEKITPQNSTHRTGKLRVLGVKATVGSTNQINLDKSVVPKVTELSG